MFGRKKTHGPGIDALVGGSTRVNGDIHFEGGFHVDGHVNGNVHADPDTKAVLTVSEQGCIEGSVNVPHVVLNGTVKGDVCAGQRVELGSSARVIGNVYYNLIEMAIGAEINGKLIHEPAGTSKKPASTAPSKPAPVDSLEEDIIQLSRK